MQTNSSFSEPEKLKETTLQTSGEDSSIQKTSVIELNPVDQKVSPANTPVGGRLFIRCEDRNASIPDPQKMLDWFRNIATGVIELHITRDSRNYCFVKFDTVENTDEALRTCCKSPHGKDASVNNSGNIEEMTGRICVEGVNLQVMKAKPHPGLASSSLVSSVVHPFSKPSITPANYHVPPQPFMGYYPPLGYDYGLHHPSYMDSMYYPPTVRHDPRLQLEESDRVIARNVPHPGLVHAEAVIQHFAMFGRVSDYYRPTDFHTGRPKDFAFVRYSSSVEAQHCASTASQHLHVHFAPGMTVALAHPKGTSNTNTTVSLLNDCVGVGVTGFTPPSATASTAFATVTPNTTPPLSTPGPEMMSGGFTVPSIDTSLNQNDQFFEDNLGRLHRSWVPSSSVSTPVASAIFDPVWNKITSASTSGSPRLFIGGMPRELLNQDTIKIHFEVTVGVGAADFYLPKSHSRICYVTFHSWADLHRALIYHEIHGPYISGVNVGTIQQAYVKFGKRIGGEEVGSSTKKVLELSTEPALMPLGTLKHQNSTESSIVESAMAMLCGALNTPETIREEADEDNTDLLGSQSYIEKDDPAVNAAAAFLLGVLNNNSNTGTNLMIHENYTPNECSFPKSPPVSPKLQPHCYFGSENSNIFGASTMNPTSSSNFSGSFPGTNITETSDTSAVLSDILQKLHQVAQQQQSTNYAS